MAGSGAGTWKVDADGRLMEMVVFADVDGVPVPAGVLSFKGVPGRMRQGVFRYDEAWRRRPGAKPLAATGLPLRRSFQSLPPHEIPLPLYDASPDGWGKAILSMAYPDVPLAAPEYIAAAGGDRIGHLHFGPDDQAPEVWVPAKAMIDLPGDEDDLEGLADAADAVENGVATRSHLAKLLDSGADIGGARPKARIFADGEPWIVKMRARDDAFDHQRVEAACLSVAREAGIDTPDHRVTEIAGRSVLLVKRFDRTGVVRHAYTSAATILGQPPGTYGASDASYADLAIAARRAGIADCAKMLFERLLLNCFLNNTDDHLHNHGFIDDGDGWRLSPVFDVVPQARRALVLRPARHRSAEADPSKALEAHEAFGLSREEADECYARIRAAAASFPKWLDRHEVSAMDREAVMRRVPHLP
ncbi:type II toxin-antitoxin system HipA family toxin [Azospirillum agricola]|uniref:type II toxin-antitoxin system HipA family toxin n=1 Tax=Azospirillum agricola TaxID=1720247 RepID=UPI001AE4FBF0|nr:HipA domain-containing protein [Azospirillum agricola]